MLPQGPIALISIAGAILVLAGLAVFLVLRSRRRIRRNAVGRAVDPLAIPSPNDNDAEIHFDDTTHNGGLTAIEGMEWSAPESDETAWADELPDLAPVAEWETAQLILEESDQEIAAAGEQESFEVAIPLSEEIPVETPFAAEAEDAVEEIEAATFATKTVAEEWIDAGESEAIPLSAEIPVETPFAAEAEDAFEEIEAATFATKTVAEEWIDAGESEVEPAGVGAESVIAAADEVGEDPEQTVLESEDTLEDFPADQPVSDDLRRATLRRAPYRLRKARVVDENLDTQISDLDHRLDALEELVASIEQSLADFEPLLDDPLFEGEDDHARAA